MTERETHRKPFHQLVFRVHQHATEDPAKVRAALAAAAGVPLEKLARADVKTGKPVVEEETMEGFHGNPIVALAFEVKAGRLMDDFFSRLLAEPGVRERLLAEIPRRLDDDANFYLRVGKQEALAGRLVLASDDDAVQVRGKVTRFPGEASPPEKLRAYLLKSFR